MTTENTLLSQTATSNTNANTKGSGDSLLNQKTEGTKGSGDSLLNQKTEGTIGQETTTQTTSNKGNKANEKADPVVPEKYEFKFPEGITINEEMAGEFSTLAKEMKMTQEQAQKFVDIQAKHALSHTQKVTEDYNKTVDSWKKESLEKLGTDHQAKLAYVHKFLDKFATPETRTLLEETGLANNWKIIEPLMKAGQLIAEDRGIDGKTSAGAKKSHAEVLYPNMTK